MGQQTSLVVNLGGGLDLSSTHYTLQQLMGKAKILNNYEASLEGGYRKVNGFVKWGTERVGGLGGNSPVLGLMPYANGIVAVITTNIWYSEDGDTWTQLNKDTYVAQGTGTLYLTETGGNRIYLSVTGGTESTDLTSIYSVGGHIRINGVIREIASVTATDITVSESFPTSVPADAAYIHYKNGADDTALAAGSVIGRAGQSYSHVEWYEQDGDYGAIIVTDHSGDNKAARIRITGESGSYIYEYDEIDEDFGFKYNDGSAIKPYHSTVFERRVIYAGSNVEPNTIWWSDRFSTLRIDGASAGSVSLSEPVLAIQPFKDRLIIFCRNSIHQLVNIDDPTGQNIQVLTITSKTGLAVENSVQELSGDLLFLSHDGVRTLNATDQYGDVTLGTISHSIDPIINDLIANIQQYEVSSVVIRERNQYRLFYTKQSALDGTQKGLIVTRKIGLSGQLEWQWSQLVGWPVSCIESTSNKFALINERESVFHGGYSGYIYRHDYGNSFDGADIQATMKLHEIDYGDIGRRKTLHYVQVFGEAEALTEEIRLKVLYDFGGTDVHQPDLYTIPAINGLAYYGTSKYGTAVYGESDPRFSKRILVEGSGYSNNFAIESKGTGGSYSINSIYIDFRAGASR